MGGEGERMGGACPFSLLLLEEEEEEEEEEDTFCSTFK